MGVMVIVMVIVMVMVAVGVKVWVGVDVAVGSAVELGSCVEVIMAVGGRAVTVGTSCAEPHALSKSSSRIRLIPSKIEILLIRKLSIANMRISNIWEIKIIPYYPAWRR
jgi:hypothetical protein